MIKLLIVLIAIQYKNFNDYESFSKKCRFVNYYLHKHFISLTAILQKRAQIDFKCKIDEAFTKGFFQLLFVKVESF